MSTTTESRVFNRYEQSVSPETLAKVEAELQRRGIDPVTGKAVCVHDFRFLRTEEIKATATGTSGMSVPVVTSMNYQMDVFYCRRCLEYRKVSR